MSTTAPDSTSAAKFIDANGGPAAFAAKLGKTPGAVRQWKHFDYFPREAWPEIQLAFPEVTLAWLLKTEATGTAPEKAAS